MRAFRSHAIQSLAAMPLATPDAERALLDQRFPAGARIGVVDASVSGVFVTVDGDRWHGGRRDTRTNAPRRVRERVVVGERTLDYAVDATGFWQVHREAPSLLASRVTALSGQGDTALELYAGAGLLTVPLADSFAAVVSIEADANAVRAARRNLADAPHVRLVEGDVGAQLAAGVGRHDVVVLDPPRSGAGRATLVAVAGTGARRVVYVACDPVALARDARTLGELGYELASAEAWDLFPMTHHVEAIAVFERG
jgi:tRNA/tmRNA/rRNA uracil-C5-methylase (TrmA/RlmC/RlmD family)